MRVLASGRTEAPSGEPRIQREAQGSSRRRGGLFFAYFLLAAQKKVGRLRGRTPRVKRSVAQPLQKKPWRSHTTKHQNQTNHPEAKTSPHPNRRTTAANSPSKGATSRNAAPE